MLIKNRGSFLTFVALLFSFENSYALTPPICKEKRDERAIYSDNYKTNLEQALRSNPQDVECMIKLASLYLKSDNVSKGFFLVAKAYGIDPKYVQSRNISRVLDLALRVTRLEDLARKNGNYDLYNELGNTYYDMGIFSDARVAFSNSLKLNPNQNDIKILLALSLGNEDKMKEAAKVLREVLDSDPFNFYANYYYGKILKNELHKPEDGQSYILAAEYIFNNMKPKFKSKQERDFLKKDLIDELLQR